MIRPSALPKHRDRMVRLLTDPASNLLAAYPGRQERFALSARHLTVGGLYWVAPDMAALAVSAGRALDTISLDMQTRPAAAGLMVMDGGVGLAHFDREQQLDIPIEAVSWGPGPDGLALTFWGARSRIQDRPAPPPGSPGAGRRRRRGRSTGSPASPCAARRRAGIPSP